MQQSRTSTMKVLFCTEADDTFQCCRPDPSSNVQRSTTLVFLQQSQGDEAPRKVMGVAAAAVGSCGS